MKKFHLSPSLIFKLYGAKREKIKYAFSFDYKSLALSSLDFLKNPSKIISFAGLNFYRGFYKDKEVVVANAGTYSPDTAIGTEILCFLGAQYLIRVGSCGALDKGMKIGDSVLVTSTLDCTGVNKFYPKKSAISLDLNKKIERALADSNIYKGKVCSFDALFRETKEIITEMSKKGSIAVDMAVATFFKVAGMYGRKASSFLVVSDNLITGEIGFKDKVFHKTMNDSLRKIFEVLNYV